MGTTGDIAPYSVATPDGYVGIDIDLARDLGRALGRPIDYVETTWTTLVRDARQGSFDLAMSGIMVVPSREMFVDFSLPYDEADHFAVVRCEDRDRYPTVEDLDSSDVTVFVRKGATSASTALSRLVRARVRQVDSIEAAYGQLADGEGSVLVAMGFLRNEHPGLCLGLKGAPLWTASISVLLPRDSPLLGPIDGWLTRRIDDGTVQAIIQRHRPR